MLEVFRQFNMSLNEPLAGGFLYMSPEQIRGEAPAERWDLWAITVVAFEMLTGVHPFGAADRRNVLIGGEFQPIQTQAPALTPQLREFFERALAADRSSRPVSACQFIGELKAALSNHPADLEP